MCPVCPGESIDQSQNQLAIDMRGVVAEKLSEGWTDRQVREFFVERYGPSVLLEPPREGFSLIAWVLPPVGVVGAGTGLFFVVRAMRGRNRPASDGGTGVELSDEERTRYFDIIQTAISNEDGRRTDQVERIGEDGRNDSV